MNKAPVLGIALTESGAGTLSAVLLDGAGREARGASVPWTPGEALTPALARLAGKLPAARRARVCLLGLSLAALSVRRLHSPFADAGKRARTFPFALEESLLVPAEQVAGVFTVLSEDENGADLLAYAARREALRRLFAGAQESSLAPDIACPALHALAAALGESCCFLLVHGDAEAADMALVREGKIMDCRRAIPDGSEAFSSDLLAAGIRQSLALFRQDGAADQPERLVLCGALAQLPELAETLSAALNLPCGRPRFRPRNLTPEHDAALACALLALQGGEMPNFRVGEFAKKSVPWSGWRGWSQNRVRRWAVLGAATALVCLALLWGQSHRLSTESVRLRAEMARVYRSAHPEVTVTREPYMEMRAARQTRGDAALPPLFDPERPGALALLADISGRIPQDLTLTAQRLVLEPGGASLRGETGSFGEVDRIRALLAASPHFAGARILSSTAEQSGGKERVRFELRLDADETEDGR